jgi:hypothetical protein
VIPLTREEWAALALMASAALGMLYAAWRLLKG